jgi:hypothetical protein
LLLGEEANDSHQFSVSSAEKVQGTLDECKPQIPPSHLSLKFSRRKKAGDSYDVCERLVFEEHIEKRGTGEVEGT